MAKKSKDDIPNANSVANRDILQRLNFLYQASVYLNGLPSSPDGSNLPSAKAEGKRSRRNRTRCANAAELAQSYMKDMKVVGKKTIVRMDPSVKRTVCKNCSAPLIPGLSARVRVKSSSSHRHAVTSTCLACSSSRRLPAPPVVLPESNSKDDPMDADQLADIASTHRKGPAPRPPPLFQREGHVILRGNSRLTGEDQ